MLRSGGRISNVVAVPTRSGYLVVFKSGRVRNMPGSAVLRVQVRPVRWPPGLSPADVDRLVHERVTAFRKEQSSPKEPQQPAAPGPSLWPSLLLPGFAQYRQNRTAKAFFFGGGSLVLGGAYYMFAQDRRRALRELDTAYALAAAANGTGSLSLPLSALALARAEQARSRASQGANFANVSVVLFLALYAWNLVDAPCRAEPTLGVMSLSPGFDRQDSGWQIQFGWKL